MDYEIVHGDIRSKRESSTGTWFLESPEFSSWMEGTQKNLFCPGIPGAGKTTIASKVIDHLKGLTVHDPSPPGLAFLYCSYGRRSEEGVVNLLISILGQLLPKQSPIPESIKKFFIKQSQGRTSPQLDEILPELCPVTKEYPRVFVVIDALDECQNDYTRRKLLDGIYEIQKQSDVRLMTTFRPGIIQDNSEVIKLEIRARKDDIELYVYSQMELLSTVVRKDLNLQSEIKARVLSLANGM